MEIQMVYKVLLEKSYDTCSFNFKKYETIDEIKIKDVFNAFKNYQYDEYDDKDYKEIIFYKKDVFGKKSMSYDLKLLKYKG
jgi:hypothetical protein